MHPAEAKTKNPYDNEFQERLAALDLHLNHEQLYAVNEARDARNQTFGAEVTALEEVANVYGGLSKTGTIEQAADGLAAVIDERLAEYLQTPEGKNDERAARLARFIRTPREQTDKVALKEVAAELQIGFGGLKHALMSGSRRHAKIHKEAQRRLEGQDEPDERAALQKASDITSQTPLKPIERSDLRNGGDPENGTEMLAVVQQDQDRLEEDGRAIVEAWSKASSSDMQPILKAIVRGDLSAAQLINHLQTKYDDRRDKERRADLTRALRKTLGSLEDEAIFQLAEASLVGLSYGEAEQSLLAEYQQAADTLISLLGDDKNKSQFVHRVEGAVKEKQREFESHGIDSSLTQYWQFTPRTIAIAADPHRALRSAGYDDIETTYSLRSEGIHFTRPGDWRGHAGRDDRSANYMQYAHTGTVAGRDNDVIDQSFGSAIVFPLDSLTATTPLRTERKTTVRGETAAADATFRPEDLSTQYGYSLRNAYIVPFYTDEQLEKTGMLPFDANGDPMYPPAAEPLREIYRNQGFPESWIAKHIIDIPEEVFVAGGTTLAAYAQAEIDRRMRTEKAEKKITALRARPGLFEKGNLDRHGETSRAAIEQLIVVE